MILALGAGAGRAAQPEPEAVVRDMLVFQDGDRVQGRFVERDGDIIVFDSDRFGQLRVPASKAVVIKAEGLAQQPVDPNAPAEGVPPAPAQTEWYSSAMLTARLRDFFGPWGGRLAFSTDLVADSSDRATVSVEALLKRKWKSDELQLNGRYDYSETNALTTTDMVKLDVVWRHNFPKNYFTQYRPTVEWNRANYRSVGAAIDPLQPQTSARSGVPSDYVLLQQEIGVGVGLINKQNRKLYVGVSENLFNVWNTSPPTTQDSHTSASVFLETELKLPWRLTLTDRGVYYYSFNTQTEGWENRFELNKKFSETLSTAIRHEIRYGTPNRSVQDYRRLRLLFGLDF